MAMIKCSECGHDVSDLAPTCPNCGAPVKKIVEEAKAQENKEKRAANFKKNKGKIIGIAIAAIAVAVILIVTLVVVPKMQKDAKYAVGNYVTFGHYPQTEAGDDNTPIEWLVLDRDGNKALLISKYGLDAKRYDAGASKVTWETCALRTWLNSTFMNKAFTTTEQKAILTTNVDNSQSQCYSGWDTNGGNNTQDQVFLLSYAEANKYFHVQYWKIEGADSNVESRIAPTAYAEKQGAYTDSNYKTADRKGTAYWWLRSPGYSQNFAADVYTDGSLDSNFVDYDRYAVRPAMWVNLESEIF